MSDLWRDFCDKSAAVHLNPVFHFVDAALFPKITSDGDGTETERSLHDDSVEGQDISS